VSVADFNCSCPEQIFQFKDSRSNVAQCAEVLEQHRECRVMEDPPESASPLEAAIAHLRVTIFFPQPGATC
jgi:hypothetical protein